MASGEELMTSEELVPNQPELAILRDMKIYYPPISLILYSVDPIANPEALFLFLILSRSEAEPDRDIFVGTFYLDFNNLFNTSVIPTPLTSKFRQIIEDSPNIHFRSYESEEEFLKAMELYYRSSNHMYFFIPYLKETQKTLPERIGFIVKKLKSSGRKSATVNIFLDSYIYSSSFSRLLLYYSDAIFSLRFNERTSRKELVINKLSFSNAPSMPLEMAVDNDTVRFQIMRSY